MDTVTAILEGKAVNLCDQHPSPVTVQLVSATASYQAVAAPAGTFRFFHIPAGNYALTATHPACRPLAPSPIKLGSGDIADVKLGMRCR
ncbi:carboxypeptidase-like regulatory domain-containing protein [Hymenobacter coccineus]|nr:carboxypeptidase-like regulatory domain-containing protein [Hymenobacter coccineus]